MNVLADKLKMSHGNLWFEWPAIVKGEPPVDKKVFGRHLVTFVDFTEKSLRTEIEKLTIALFNLRMGKTEDEMILDPEINKLTFCISVLETCLINLQSKEHEVLNSIRSEELKV